MGLGDHVNLQLKRGVKIITCDPQKRLIEAETRNGEVITVNAYNYTPSFRWPKPGEKWMVGEENGSWYLEGIYEAQGTEGSTTQAEPGDVVLSSSSGRILVNEEGKLTQLETGGGGKGNQFSEAAITIETKKSLTKGEEGEVNGILNTVEPAFRNKKGEIIAEVIENKGFQTPVAPHFSLILAEEPNIYSVGNAWDGRIIEQNRSARRRISYEWWVEKNNIGEILETISVVSFLCLEPIANKERFTFPLLYLTTSNGVAKLTRLGG